MTDKDNPRLETDPATAAAPHPAAPRLAYGQEGRAGIVFQLLTPDGQAHALKVFKPRFQVPAMVMLAERLARLADVPGLAVCHRSVLSAHSRSHISERYKRLGTPEATQASSEKSCATERRLHSNSPSVKYLSS